MPAHFDWFVALAESPISILLAACSVVTLGVAIERALHFFKRHGDADRILRDMLEHVRAGEVRRAKYRCDRTEHPFGAVARRLLDCPDPMSSASDEKLAVALSEQKLLLERNLGVLGTMAAIAPLIGLLGTVWGIMRAFGDMARVGSAAPSVVASGVAEALVTTAAGLIVAVPALVLYNHFARRANTMLTVSENHARTLRAELAEFRVAEGSDARGPDAARTAPTIPDRAPVPDAADAVPGRS
jgi:biopolymer transport protein ExbB